jgi:hypothetical protein
MVKGIFLSQPSAFVKHDRRYIHLADLSSKFACGVPLCTCIVVLWIRFRIRIRRIFKVLGLPDPHPDPLVTSTDTGLDPNPNPPAKIEKKLYFYVLRLDFLPLLRIRIRMFWGLPDPHPDPLYRGTDPRMRGIVL